MITLPDLPCPQTLTVYQNEILRQLGARHPTPSLGKLDLDFINVAGHEKRDAFPEAEAMPEAEPKAHKNEHMKAAILAVIRKTLSHARRGLEWAGVARSADAEANAYEGMESLVRRPEYQVRLRM